MSAETAHGAGSVLESLSGSLRGEGVVCGVVQFAEDPVEGGGGGFVSGETRLLRLHILHI